jgi:hypothetical protein
MKATINRNANPEAGRYALNLIADTDGQYRWFGEDGTDSEVSGATPEAAVQAAQSAWRSDCGANWDLHIEA